MSNDVSNFLSNPDGFNPELLKLALHSSILSILVTDNRLPDNPIIYCNPAFETITGYSRDEVIGLNCRFLQGSEQHSESALAIREALMEGRDVEIVIKNFKKDGSVFYNELHISPIRDSEGTISHFIGIQLDVTSGKDLKRSGSHYTTPREKGLKGFFKAVGLLIPFK